MLLQLLEGGSTVPPNAFGGPWTQIKLEVLRDYLQAYTTALKNQPFQTIYVDAFAGTGSVLISNGTFLEGSTKIALETDGFGSYLFIERDAKRVEELNQMCDAYRTQRGRVAEVRQGDANAVLVPWLSSRSFHNVRGVAFLDPFGMDLAWDTLASIVATKVFDVWYLFPLSGLYRQAAHDPRDIDATKATAITRVLGTDEWRRDWYRESPQQTFFGDTTYVRDDVDSIEQYVRQRLESIFAKVSKPLRLPKQGGPPRYSLFFGVSNPNPNAGKLAMKIAQHILSHA